MDMVTNQRFGENIGFFFSSLSVEEKEINPSFFSANLGVTSVGIHQAKN